MPRPRVAMVMPDPSDPGGVTHVIDVWMKSGLRERATIVPVTMSAWDAPRSRQLWQALRGCFRLTRLLARRRVDLVHVHVSSGGSLFRKTAVALLSRLWRVPVLVHLHSGGFADWVRTSRSGGRAGRWLFSHSDAVVVVAESWVELARELGASRIVVVPHFLPIEQDAALSEVAAKRTGVVIDRSAIRFLYYGRWAETKGVDVLAEAVRLVAGTVPPFQLRVFGNGDREWLEKCFREVDGETLHLGEWLDEETKLRELEAATVFVYPSRVEAFGQTLLEAMRTGVPIITTEAGAIPEVVSGYPLVRMIPPGDSEALAGALRETVSGDWPPSASTASYERTDRSETVATIGDLYESMTGDRRR